MHDLISHWDEIKIRLGDELPDLPLLRDIVKVRPVDVVIIWVHVTLHGGTEVIREILKLVGLIPVGINPGEVFRSAIEVEEHWRAGEYVPIGIRDELVVDLDVDGAEQDLDDCIGVTVVVDGTIVPRGPDFQHIRNPRRVSIATAKSHS